MRFGGSLESASMLRADLENQCLEERMVPCAACRSRPVTSTQARISSQTGE
jgi:hypothetical protein